MHAANYKAVPMASPIVTSVNQRLEKTYILVVSSNDKINDLLVNIFSTLGFKKVFSAQDGLSAFNLMKRTNMDLIITDWDIGLREQQPMTLDDNTKKEIEMMGGD